jgi:DNA-binding transcriptional LysR family regulator
LRDLPIELLRTFVAVVELRTMARAARAVGRTPSAVSLQMSRLAEVAGRPLFRHGRSAQGLTAAGETLLRHARAIIATTDRALGELSDDGMQGPVRFGIVQDVADTLLPAALAEFAATHPAVTLDVHVGTSSLLLDEADAGALDFAVCFESRRAARVIRRMPLVWLGRPSAAELDPLPVAILQPACALCDEWIAALAAAGRRHRVALRTPSLSGLRAALEAGLAVGTRTPLLCAGNIEVLGPVTKLPPLPEVAFALHVPRALSPAARRVATLVRRVVSQPQAVTAAGAPLSVVAS